MAVTRGRQRERSKTEICTECVYVCVFMLLLKGNNFPTYIKLYSAHSDLANLHCILVSYLYSVLTNSSVRLLCGAASGALLNPQ